MFSAMSDDPFSVVIQELRDSLQSAQGLLSPLQTATGIVTEFDSALSTVRGIDDVLKVVKDVVVLLDGAAAALSPIPVVGEIADGLEEGVLQPATNVLTDVSKTFDEVYREAIKPALSILDDLKSGLTKITRVVTEATITVPQYLNTVQILSYLLDIAQPLTGMLEGTEPGQRLEQIVDTLQKVKDDVGKALKPFADGLTIITSGVAPFSEGLQKAFDALGSGPQQAIRDLQQAGDKLRPIAQGFEKAIDAFAPIRWALNAAACIVDKVLTPVVKWILKVTGLQQLVDEAKQKVLDWIGVGPILKTVQDNVNSDAINSSGSVLNSSAGSAANTALQDFCKALGDYRTDKSKALQDAIDGLLSAITGTPVDPSKAHPLPPWPALPSLHGSDNGIGASVFGHYDPHGRLHALFESAHSVHSSIAAARSSPPMSLLLLSNGGDTPLPIDPAKWPQSAALVQSVNDNVKSVVDLSAAAQTLQTSLGHFQNSLSLPDQFGAQISALQTAFTTCEDAIAFLSNLKLKFLDTLLIPVDAILKIQVADERNVIAAIPQLQSAVQKLAQAATSVISEMPNATVITTAVQRMDGWVLGLQQMVATIEAGEADPSMDPQTLAAGKQRIESNASALHTRFATLAQTVQSLTTCVGTLQNALDVYGSALSSVSLHSESISTRALPSLQHVAVMLGKVDSIFEPLSSLLTAEQCVDPGSAQKLWAQTARDLMFSDAQGAAQPPTSFTELIANFAAEQLPLGQIEKAVKSAADEIDSQSVTAFLSSTEGLKSSLAALSQTLQRTQQYSYLEIPTDPASRVEVRNDLVDQEFVDKALQLLQPQTHSIVCHPLLSH